MKDKTVDTGRDIAEYNGKEEKREGKKEEFERGSSNRVVVIREERKVRRRDIRGVFSRYSTKRRGEARRGEASSRGGLLVGIEFGVGLRTIDKCNWLASRDRTWRKINFAR